MSSEYFNLRVFFYQSTLPTQLQEHEYYIYDTFDNLILQNTENIKSKARNGFSEYSIEYNDMKFGNLKLDKNVNFRSELLLHEMELFLNDQIAASWSIQNKVLTDDLISVLKWAEDLRLEIPEVIINLLVYLRLHVHCHSVYFYSIADRHTLRPTVGYSKDGHIYPDEFDHPIFNLPASIAACNKQIFFSNNVANDPNLSPFVDQGNMPKNLAAFPIFHSDHVVGVYVLINKMGGQYSERDLDIIRRFEEFSGHILEENLSRIQLNEAEKFNEGLSKYLSSSVAENIKSKGLEKIGGVKKNVVIMFLIIQGFDKIASQVPPKKLVPLLNHFYEEMDQIIKKYEGTLDKIITPAMMVVWNHPYEQHNAIQLALDCAIDMQQRVHEYLVGHMGHFGIENFSIGIGVNSGEAVAGNLGSRAFLDYTVIGDTINTAQRLEASAGKNQTLINIETYRGLYGKTTRLMDRIVKIKVKGKSRPIIAVNYFNGKEKDAA